LNYREVFVILKDKRGLVHVDGKPRSDPKYPVGIMDVISIKATGEHFRLQYDVKGRFQLQRISDEEAKFKLCSVKKRLMGDNGVPYIVTRDGRTIRYPHPEIKADDTIKLDLATGAILEHIKFEDGNLALVTGGKNQGRLGVVTHKETHEGAIDIVHIRDAKGHTFATRIVNLYIIGKGKDALITLPKGEGIKLNIVEEQNAFYAKKQHH
jgi:small subunit ribosomal protein S4e